ncbi:hypothetical protein [Mycobacterium sp.]|nr:hypothetical protein [Mycobacterium sp.]
MRDTLTTPSEGVNVLVVHRDGSTACGPIKTTATGTLNASVTVVAHC